MQMSELNQLSICVVPGGKYVQPAMFVHGLDLIQDVAWMQVHDFFPRNFTTR